MYKHLKRSESILINNSRLKGTISVDIVPFFVLNYLGGRLEGEILNNK